MVSVTGPRDTLLSKVISHLSTHGVGDTSLRSLATGVGTSHRMLIYHFGSREELLAVVVDVMARRHLEGVGEYLRADHDADPRAVAWGAWERMADDVPVFAPLLFELSAYAMTGHEWATQLRGLVVQATTALARYFQTLGHPAARAHVLASTAMAISRGVAYDLALNGDRKAADEVIRNFLDGSLAAG